MAKFNRAETVKEIQKLRKNIVRRVERVKTKYGTTPAVASFEEKNLDLGVRGKSEAELKGLLNELRYFDRLRTLNMSGAKHYAKTFKEIEASLDTFERKNGKNPTKDRFWRLYSQFVEENQLLENYKYKVFETIHERVSKKGYTDKQIKQAVDKLFESEYLTEENKKAQVKRKNAPDISLKYEEFK